MQGLPTVTGVDICSIQRGMAFGVFGDEVAGCQQADSQTAAGLAFVGAVASHVSAVLARRHGFSADSQQAGAESAFDHLQCQLFDFRISVRHNASSRLGPGRVLGRDQVSFELAA
jgi:hypothetical protein